MFAIVAALYIQVLPWSFGAIENLTTFVHADFIANFARPGAFSQLETGFVFHFRERTPDGALHGVFMQDMRDPAQVSTYIAEAGKTIDRDGTSYLQLSKGVLLRPQSAGDSAMVTFDDYTIDLSQFIHAVGSIKRPRERTTASIDGAGRTRIARIRRSLGHIRSELLDRLASPLYAFVAGLIAFAALGEARTTRQGRGLAIGGAILAFFGAPHARHRGDDIRSAIPSAAYFVWGVPLAACLGALALIFRGELVRGEGPRRFHAGRRDGRTLSLYLAGRFARTVVAGFCGFSSSSTWWISSKCCAAPATLRRRPAFSWPRLSFLRTPTVAEQALPFAVLFGSMIAFLNLSRKMELVVARAAGVSVWQILTPPLVVIAALGILSVVAYNPASAWMKQQADRVENRAYSAARL